MPIAVLCPSCSARLNAPDAAAGKQVKCPKCKNPMLVPDQAAAEANDFEVVEEQRPQPRPQPKPLAKVRADVVVEDDEDDRPRKKPGKAVQLDDDEDDDYQPKKKKKKQAGGGNLVRNVVGGVALVALLGVAGYVFYDRFQKNKETTDANNGKAEGVSEPRVVDPRPVGPKGGGPGPVGPIPGGGGPIQPGGPPGKGKTVGVPGQPTTLTSPSGFKVTFPGPYMTDEPPQQIRDAIGYPIRMYVGEPPGKAFQLFVAASVELPATATAAEKKKAYDAVIKTLLEEGGGKVEILSRQTIMVGGRNWEEIKLKEGTKGVGTTRLLQTDTRIFMLLVAEEGGASGSDAAKKFFDSFELTNQVTPPGGGSGTASADPYESDWRTSITDDRRAGLNKAAEQAMNELEKAGVKVERATGCSVTVPPKLVTPDGKIPPNLLSNLRLAGVRELNLDGVPLSDAGALELDRLRCLVHLTARAPVITDAGLAGLKALKALRFVELVGTSDKPLKVTGEGFKHLAGLPEVYHISVTHGLVNDAAIPQLGKFPQLKLLYFDNNPLTGTGFKGVPGLSLEMLTLMDCPVSDEGAAAIATVSVQDLSLRGTKITDVGIKAIAGSRDMLKLDITDTQVTDAGLQTLAGSPKLKKVDVRKGPKLTPEGVEKLKKAKPGLEVNVYS